MACDYSIEAQRSWPTNGAPSSAIMRPIGGLIGVIVACDLDRRQCLLAVNQVAASGDLA